MIFRIAIANVPKPNIAEAGIAAGIGGTMTDAVGFSPQWGTEPTTVVETAHEDEDTVRGFALAVMKLHGESAVYVTVDGTGPRLWWADGRIEAIGK